MNREIEQILDECLHFLEKGESLEDCLARYPEQASELEPLLRAALTTRRTLAALQPRPIFQEAARYRLLSTLAAQKEKKGLLSWPRRWAWALGSLAIFFLATGGTVAAAGRSLPDQPLYPVKLATETVQLRLALSPIAKARFEANLAERRVGEMAEMGRENKPREMARLAQRLDHHLNRLQHYALTAPGGKEGAELEVLLEQKARRHRLILQRAMQTAPPQARPHLQQALESSQGGFDQALKNLRRGRP